MTPRALLSWAGIFSLVVLVNGGCDRREEIPAQRAPRVVGSSAELFAADDAGTGKNERIVRELVGDWTPPAATETVRPPPPRKAKHVERVPIAPKEEVVAEQPAQPLPAPSPSSPPSPVVTAPVERRAPAAQAKAENTWQTLPERRSPRTDAINVSVAIGTIAVGMGSAAVAGDNTSTGARSFAIGSLGVGVLSLSTALVLYLTEPEPKAATKTSGVTVTPGVLGLRGTF